MKGYITQQILKEGPSITLAISAPVVAQEFFKRREGLFIYENERMQELLEKAPQLAGPQEFLVDSLELIVGATDEQIELSLENKNNFPEGTVCAIIAELISQQPKGAEGTLLNNGYANLFYTPACVVSVDWSAGSGCWRVSAWRRVGNRWGAGNRVFSPQLILGN